MSTSTALTRAGAATELLRRIEERSIRCGIVGLGLIGTMLAEAIQSVGFEGVGYDRADAAVKTFVGDSRMQASADPAILRDADVLVVAVRVAVSATDGPDETLESVATLTRSLPDAPRLVVLSATVPVGATREFAGMLAGRATTFVVHAPERVRVGDGASAARQIPHLVGGVDRASSVVGGAFVNTFCDEVVIVSKPEVSELSKLLENSFRAVSMALVSEVTKMAHVVDISASEVTAAAATKPFGYFPFHPGPGVGGHCLRNDLGLLRLSAASAGIASPLVEAACEVLDDMPEVTVARVEELLRQRGLALDGAEVLLVGTGFKVGSSEQDGTPARPITRCLRSRGALVSYYDSANESFSVDDVAVHRVGLDALNNRAPFVVAIVLAGDPGLAADRLTSSVELVLDAGGGRVLPGGPAGMVRL